MHRITDWLLIVAVTFTASAETINLSGTVVNKSNKPIAGAIVTLAGQNMKDTTDVSGAFSFVSGTFLINSTPILPGVEKISLTKGIISMSLAKPNPVSIEMFDMRGNLLASVLDCPASAGDYKFDITARRYGAKIMVLRVRIGKSASIFRYVQLHKAHQGITPVIAAASTGDGLAKRQAVVDSLKVTAIGFMPQTKAISSYQGVHSITLDSIKLDPFSFFVVSLKAIVDLSKSPKGFGGDLRFGKTGDGAGLLGADSICECAAERSMEGSKVKIWRAFLSVSKGPNGQQVNAIDRIGQGPWYDRIGNLVSKNISDLLHDRPASADSAIINDLPNEYGVPNHKPDPNKPTEDNHHMITGTGTNGKLYRADATCNDWTSKSTSLKGPYGGLSWPRAGMGSGLGSSNWMSGMTLCGCKDSITVVESGGPPTNCNWIGGGGGYGGFYCFALNP